LTLPPCPSPAKREGNYGSFACDLAWNNGLPWTPWSSRIHPRLWKGTTALFHHRKTLFKATPRHSKDVDERSAFQFVGVSVLKITLILFFVYDYITYMFLS
jgi:hypothetical protein